MNYQEKVNIDNYLETMKLIQHNIIKYLKDKESVKEEERFSKIVKCEDIKNDIQVLKEMLHILSALSINHHRGQRFFTKIENIINYYKVQIQKLPNQQLFEIFKKSKRILLFLFKQKLLIPDAYIFTIISKPKYSNAQHYLSYFYNEFKSFMSQQKQEEILETLPEYERYENYRQEGENENYICKLIRNDSIQDFITFINQNPNSLSLKIQPSIFETNSYLINKNMSLIEYAAFFGSFQIFQYLYLNNIKLTTNLWIWAIHGNNADIIHLLEEILNNNTTKNNTTNNTHTANYRTTRFYSKAMNYTKTTSNQDFISLYKESIICHHNKIAKYLLDNYIQQSQDFHKEYLHLYYITYNYQLITNNLIITNLLFLIKYDYLHYIRYQISNNMNNVLETLSQPLRKNKCTRYGSDFLDSNSIPILIYSIKKGNCEIVEYLLSIKNINANDPYKIKKDLNITTPPLILAIENGNSKIVDILLSNPMIDPNKKKVIQIINNNANNNFLRKSWGNFQVNSNSKYRNLIQNNLSSKVNYCHFCIDNKNNESQFNYEFEKSALQIAFEKNNPIIFDKLLSNDKIDVNQKMMNQKYSNSFNLIESKAILHIIVGRKNEKFFSKLLEKRNDVDINELQTIQLIHNNNNVVIECKTPLYIALDTECSKIANFLLSNEKIIINKKIKICDFFQDSNIIQIDNKNVFHLVVEKDNIEMVDKLISTSKIDINEFMVTSHYDYKKNYYDTVTSKSPLHIAILNQKYNLVQKLLEYENCDINSIFYEHRKSEFSSVNKTSLFLAIENSTIDIINLLLQNDLIDVNEKTIYKYNNEIVKISSPLYMALHNNNRDQVKLLLDKPDLLMNDKYIMKIVPGSTKDITYDKIIFRNKNNNNNNIKTTLKLTPLYYAVAFCNTDIVKMLMETDSEINVNAKSTIKTKTIVNNNNNNKIIKKETALQFAVDNYNFDIVQLLLKYKQIDINTKTITKNDNTTIVTDYSKFMRGYKQTKDQTKAKTNDENKIIKNEIIEHTALSIAIKNKNEQILLLLLQHIKIKYNDKLIYNKTTDDYKLNKQTIISEEKSMLTLAAETNNATIIQKLLDMPKIKANEINNYSCISIEKDFNLNKSKNNLKNNQQRTALTTAVMSNKLISVKCLLNSEKVDPNLVLSFANTLIEKKVAFHIAIENDFVDILKLLIENKNIDLSKMFIQDASNKYHADEPIVYFAVRNSKIESLKILLGNPKIDFNDTSRFINYENKSIVERSAFQFANTLDNYDMIKLLKEKNAEIKYEKVPLIA